jgi:hypothetical protein
MEQNGPRHFLDDLTDGGKELYRHLIEMGDQSHALVALQMVGELVFMQKERNSFARELADLRDENAALRAGAQELTEDSGEQYVGRVVAEVRQEDAEAALARVMLVLDQAEDRMAFLIPVSVVRDAAAGK